MWRKVEAGTFDDILADAPATASFRDEFAKHEFTTDRRYIDAAIHEGPLAVDGVFKPPAFHTLVVGDLTVNGVIDLRTEWEFAGLFIVLGNVRATNFLSEYSAGVFIDGDLDLDVILLSAFSDSSFTVIGSLTARLHIGNDIPVHVGAGALVEYAIGHRLPLEGGDSFAARHGEAATIAAMTLAPRDEGYPFDEEDVARAVREGRPLLTQ